VFRTKNNCYEDGGNNFFLQRKTASRGYGVYGGWWMELAEGHILYGGWWMEPAEGHALSRTLLIAVFN
jgi:hypothetical protein